MKEIFNDFEILNLEKDLGAPGLFLKAQKQSNYKSVNLENIELYSMIVKKRTSIILDNKSMPFFRKIKIFAFKSFRNLNHFISKLIKLE